MTIRHSNREDLPEMLEIYEEAKAFMRETGNPNQWNGTYPEPEVLLKDMELGNSYIIEENGKIAGTFAFIVGIDPTYLRIENGAWLNDEPYGTIHRLAGRKEAKGVGTACFDWCGTQIRNLRIDTHEENKVMQGTLAKNGFVKCGIIYLENGNPRLAFQKVLVDAQMPEQTQQPQYQNQQQYQNPPKFINPMNGQPQYQGYPKFQGQPQYQMQQPKDDNNNGFGIASFVLGIIAILMFCTCINIPMAILSIIFGIVQLVKSKPKAFAVTGIITSAISIILTMILYGFMLSSPMELYDDYNEQYHDYYDDHTDYVDQELSSEEWSEVFDGYYQEGKEL